MTVNLMKRQLDQPVFEWMRFAPAFTAPNALTSANDGSNRLIYYLAGQSFYRYDTYSDSWQGLAPCPVSPNSTSGVVLKYSKTQGNRGWVLAASSNTITIGASRYDLFEGMKVRIVSGTGAGQERTISSISDSTIHAAGSVSYSVSGTATIAQDASKRWRVNQWRGYGFRITQGGGTNQVRKILLNSTDTIYLADTSLQGVDSFNNTPMSTVSPYSSPVGLAGVNAPHYVIESSVVTVSSAWTVTPDSSSRFMIMGGGIWMMTGTGSASPSTATAYYDVATDTWHTKRGHHFYVSAVADVLIMEGIGEFGGPTVSGTATSGGSRSLTNSSAAMTIDRWANYQLRITGGTGVGQYRRIVGNTATSFQFERNWDINPDSTSTYEVYPDSDKIWMAGNSTGLIQYSIDRDHWTPGPLVDYGHMRNACATLRSGSPSSYGPAQEGIAINTVARATNGILTVAVNAAGTGYAVGDLISATTTGTNGRVWVTSVGAGGTVTGVELAACGSGYSAGTSSTSAVSGTGTGLTLTITVGVVAIVTCITNHNLKTGESVALAGFATDTSFNGNFTILGVDTVLTFQIAAPSSTSSPTIAATQTTALVVDAAKNWTVNEHVGRICTMTTMGTGGGFQMRRIVSNTNNVLTVGSVLAITQYANGNGAYTISEPSFFAATVTNRTAGKERYGWVSSSTATSLTDSTKNWDVNQYNNCKVRIICGTGVGGEASITATSATSLTVGSWPNGTPDTTSKYEILDASGACTASGTTTLTDSAKNWPVGYLQGKRVWILAGSGSGNNVINSNNTTSTTLGLLSAVATDTSTVYVVQDTQTVGNGSKLEWLHGLSDSNRKGRWLIMPRGNGGAGFTIYDIPTNTCDVGVYIAGASETLTTGAQMVYDGQDSLMYIKENTNRIYLVNLNTFVAEPAGVLPYGGISNANGNRMEVINSVEGPQYLYVLKPSEFWRTHKFW